MDISLTRKFCKLQNLNRDVKLSTSLLESITYQMMRFVKHNHLYFVSADLSTSTHDSRETWSWFVLWVTWGFWRHVSWWFHRKRIVNNLPVLEAKEEDKVGFRCCHSHKVQERPLPRPKLKRPRICPGFSLLFWGLLLFWLRFVLNFKIAAQKLRSLLFGPKSESIKTNLASEMANVVNFDIKSLAFVWVAAPKTYFVFFLGLQNR